MKRTYCRTSSIVPQENGYCKGNDYSRGQEGIPNKSESFQEKKVLQSSSSQKVQTSGSQFSSDQLHASSIPCVESPVVPPSSEYLSGLDTLHISCWVDWGNSSLLQNLSDSKYDFTLKKIDKEVSSSAEEFSLALEEGTSFNLHLKSPYRYSYKLTSADITLLLSNHNPHGYFSNLCIEIGSMSCWNPGWKHVAFEMFSLVERLGGRILKHHIKRADLTVDLFGINYEDTDFDDYKFWTHKGHKFGMAGDCNVPNYFYLGKTPLMMRAYNKTNQLKDNSVKQDFFQQLWQNYLGYVPEHVTRVEFQISRKPLKSFKTIEGVDTPINTIQDLEENLNSLWLYFVGSEADQGWARHCVRKFTLASRLHGNTGKNPTSQLWQLVRSVRFNAVRPVKLRKKLKKKTFFNEKYIKQTVCALMIAFAAERGLSPYEYGEHVYHGANQFIVYAEESLKEHAEKYAMEDYINKVQVKQNHYQSFVHDFEEEHHTPTTIEIPIV